MVWIQCWHCACKPFSFCIRTKIHAHAQMHKIHYGTTATAAVWGRHCHQPTYLQGSTTENVWCMIYICVLLTMQHTLHIGTLGRVLINVLSEINTTQHLSINWSCMDGTITIDDSHACAWIVHCLLCRHSPSLITLSGGSRHGSYINKPIIFRPWWIKSISVHLISMTMQVNMKYCTTSTEEADYVP